ncbi:MAG: hypothetical protein CM1200mP18_12690 [Gammaproteobacteria bacterium]|nr:MAG: hypothetical protein CM1200mP18_12690 [Gammaproteobacteria bacterium]
MTRRRWRGLSRVWTRHPVSGKPRHPNIFAPTTVTNRIAEIESRAAGHSQEAISQTQEYLLLRARVLAKYALMKKPVANFHSQAAADIPKVASAGRYGLVLTACAREPTISPLNWPCHCGGSHPRIFFMWWAWPSHCRRLVILTVP